MQEEQFDGFEENPPPSDGEHDFGSDDLDNADDPYPADAAADDFSDDGDEAFSEPEEPAGEEDEGAGDAGGRHWGAAADQPPERQQDRGQSTSPQLQVHCILRRETRKTRKIIGPKSQHKMYIRVAKNLRICSALDASACSAQAPPAEADEAVMAPVEPARSLAASREASPAAVTQEPASLPARRQAASPPADVRMSEPGARSQVLSERRAQHDAQQPTAAHAAAGLLEQHPEDHPVGPPALHRGGMAGTGSEWIACDECGKWRQAAVGDVARGPWTCAMNADPRSGLLTCSWTPLQVTCLCTALRFLTKPSNTSTAHHVATGWAQH